MADSVKVIGKGGVAAWVNPQVARSYEPWPEEKEEESKVGGKSLLKRGRTRVKDDAAEVPEDALESREIGKKPESE